MGIFKKFIRSQLIEVIEWLDGDKNQMVYRFPVEGNEIKMGAVLNVRESQVAVFVNEGKIADVFEPGRHELSTENMPVLTKLQSWKYGFNSPFKSEVYFVSTRQFTNMKWGTKNPVMMRDQEFGRIRIRALGLYAFKVNDPVVFLREIFGTSGDFRTDSIKDYLRGVVVSSLSDLFAESNIPVMDFTSELDELAASGKKKLQATFESIGFEITKFVVENISLPESVMLAMDERNKMSMLGVNNYSTYKAVNAMGDAANNPSGGLAGAGVGLGAGAALGNIMATSMNPSSNESVQKNMTLCPHCNESISKASKFCMSCGKSTQTEKINCIKCATELKKGSKFCSECGSKQDSKVNCVSCGVLFEGKFCPECGTKA